MDFNSIVFGVQLGALLTLTAHNVIALLTNRAERRRDQAVAAKAVRKLNADLFYVDFQAHRLSTRTWDRP